MSCPVCNAQNSAMSARCLECGTILIREAVMRPEGVQRTANRLDNRMYAGYGGLVGFVIGFGSWFVLSQDDTEVQAWLMASTLAGTLLGRVVAWRRRNAL